MHFVSFCNPLKLLLNSLRTLSVNPVSDMFAAFEEVTAQNPMLYIRLATSPRSKKSRKKTSEIEIFTKQKEVVHSAHSAFCYIYGINNRPRTPILSCSNNIAFSRLPCRLVRIGPFGANKAELPRKL